VFSNAIRRWMGVLILALLAAACGPANSAPGTGQPGAADLASRLDELQTRVEQLSAQVAALSSQAETARAAEAQADDPFAVSVAQYFLDTAGFHAIAESLSETRQVDPAYLSAVERVRRVLVATPWPEPLSQQAGDFVALLERFAAALKADDGAGAADLAEQVHAAQHELSHAIDDWLGSDATEHSH
jgi:outer membrane murein-binding lipoprotein Lpp